MHIAFKGAALRLTAGFSTEMMGSRIQYRVLSAKYRGGKISDLGFISEDNNLQHKGKKYF